MLIKNNHSAGFPCSDLIKDVGTIDRLQLKSRVGDTKLWKLLSLTDDGTHDSLNTITDVLQRILVYDICMRCSYERERQIEVWRERKISH